MPIPEWREVSPYLDEALAVPDADRESWLASLRAREPLLAARLEPLLEAYRRLNAEGFLEQSPDQLPAWPTMAGRRLGSYSLLSLLGEGGMGNVWLAERTDGELEQRVAIKLLGPAAHRPEWRDRFLRERQLLATLNHPSIVHLLDAGRTDEGLPYLVMEYVEGQAIDVYAAGIPVRDRLNLFLQVCDAVSYAHRRLVVHRDLKPSNILVDRTGQPKLLDFGIAKLLDDPGERTTTVERVLTPSYASPEQVRGAAQTTATDIYSLGAVLYKLLTGRSPNETRDGAAVPPPTRLNQSVPGDTDYVLRRALREEPDDRYVTVEGLANDVRAVLESRPVEARSGDAWYRARKFTGRHWLPITAAALVLMTLSAGLYVTNRERAIAQRRFGQVRQLANQFIALDGEIRDLPGSTKARNRIVTESLNYLAGLGAEARDDLALAFDEGDAYLHVARVQGVPASVGNLGQLAQAEQSLRNADALIDAVLAGSAKNRAALLTSANIAHDWMAVDDYQDRREEALAHAHKAAAQLDRFLQLGAPTPAEIDDATHLYSNIANAYINAGQFDQAIAFSRRALDISKGVDAARMRRAAALGKYAEALEPVGDLDGALAAVRESRTILEQMAADGGAAEQMNLINALTREGSLLGEDESGVTNAGISLGQPAAALDAFQHALERAEKLADGDPRDYRSRRMIATIIEEIGAIVRHSNPRNALTVYDHALMRLHETAANARTQRDAVMLLAGSSYAARALHQESDARRRIDEAFRLLRETKQYPADTIQPGRAEPYFALRAFADYYSDKEPEQAVKVYEELLAKIVASKPSPESNLFDASALSSTWSALADLLRRVGRTDEARALEVKRADLWKTWDAKHPGNPFVHRQLDSITRDASSSSRS